MATTFIPGHPSTKCVECESELSESEGAARPVEISVGSVPVRVGGLYRCPDCDMYVTLGRESLVGPKEAHKHLVEHVIPSLMARIQLYSMTLDKLTAAGRDEEGAEVAMEAMMFASTAAAELYLAAGLVDALDAKFGTDSTARIDERLWEIIRESTPKMTPEQVNALIDKLDIKRGTDGQVTYLCPNPDCPEDGDRHPLAFAEKVMPVELIEGIVARMPD